MIIGIGPGQKKVNSRRKGAMSERKAAILWRQWFPDCKRWFPRQQQGVKAPDIGSDKMNRLYYVEVKSYKRITTPTLARFINKAEDDMLEWKNEFDLDPVMVLMFKENRHSWYVALSEAYWPVSFIDETTVEGDGYQLGDLLIVPWDTFADQLDKLHTIAGTEVQG